MIVNKCSENLLTKSKKLYENYRDNCTVVQRMLEKYKKIYPNISDYSIMHFIDIAEFCDLIMDRKKLEGLNEDECYCLLLAALFAHTGFGLNQEIMNRYINRLVMACLCFSDGNSNISPYSSIRHALNKT